MGMGTYIVLGILVLLVLLLIGVYNSLVSKRVGCQEAWSQIDVQLKRRHDLIPNLVETVKGYASHEKETLERVISARNQAAAPAANLQERAAAENVLSGALRQLFAVTEAYPNLKANENFLSLQEELTSTENRIGFARQHYNSCVSIYNTARQVFPNSLIANTFGFAPQEFFQLEEPAERQAPQVKF